MPAANKTTNLMPASDGVTTLWGKQGGQATVWQTLLPIATFDQPGNAQLLSQYMQIVCGPSFGLTSIYRATAFCPFTSPPEGQFISRLKIGAWIDTDMAVDSVMYIEARSGSGSGGTIFLTAGSDTGAVSGPGNLGWITNQVTYADPAAAAASGITGATSSLCFHAVANGSQGVNQDTKVYAAMMQMDFAYMNPVRVVS